MSLAIKVSVCLLAWTIVSILVGSLFGRLLRILGEPVGAREFGDVPAARQDPETVDDPGSRADGAAAEPSSLGLVK